MNKTNYFLLQKNILKEVANVKSKPKLLLHSCCAPCSTFCLEKVTPYFETSVFYYNPNITIESEYKKRLNEQINFVNLVYLGSVNVIAGEYRIEDFLTKIKGLENEKEGGSRCKICYYLRLEETCKKAKELGYDYFSTTLSISPHKNATWLNEIGEELCFCEIYDSWRNITLGECFGNCDSEHSQNEHIVGERK